MPARRPADDQPARSAPGQDRVEQGQTDRRRRHQHRGDARRDVQLREHDAAVAAEEEQRADDERRPPVRACRSLERLGVAAQPCVRDQRAQHERPGGRKPNPRGQQWRQRLDHDRDAEVRRTPDHVDEEEGDRDQRGRRPRPMRGAHAPPLCRDRPRSSSRRERAAPARPAASACIARHPRRRRTCRIGTGVDLAARHSSSSVQMHRRRRSHR